MPRKSLRRIVPLLKDWSCAMLVLSRKPDEFLLIGDEIEVRVLRIEGDHVKLGIVAPRSIAVVRGELLADIHGENVSAAAAGAHELAGLSEKLRQSRLKVRPDQEVHHRGTETQSEKKGA